MVYKSNTRRLLLRIAGAAFDQFLGVLAIIGGAVTLPSDKALGTGLIILGFLIEFANRNDYKIVREVEVNGSQLKSHSLIGHGLIDLTVIAQVRIVKVVIGRYGAFDSLLELRDNSGHKACIQFKLLSNDEKQQLWAAIGPYVMKPGVEAPNDLYSSLAKMGLKQIYGTSNFPASTAQ